MVPFKNRPDGAEIVVIPGGHFLMGSLHSEEKNLHWEWPQHHVMIQYSFGIGRYPVTVGEFDAFVKATDYPIPDRLITNEDANWRGRERPGRSFRNPGFPQTARHPVVGICWNDAKAYVDWMACITGLAYRLATEAEWEYAARAGTTAPFWWGSSISSDQANYNANYTYGGGQIGTYRAATVSVDKFAPNPFGLYQVHGNVWEWCEDHWHPNYDGAPDNGSAWLGGDAEFRVLRGGSWLNGPWVLRAAQRLGEPRSLRNVSFGFRVARSL